MDDLTIACPYCSAATPAFRVVVGYNELSCAKCKKPFSALVAKIRSKRSRGNKKNGSREYDVRVIFDGQERMVHFNGGYTDIELRSGDIAVFSIANNRVCIVHNETVANTWRIQSANPGCLGSMVGILVLSGAAIVAGVRFFS